MIRFTDTRPGLVSSSAHACPNESLPHLRRALEKAEGPLKNGGSICSGGEVPLGVMLPVVDHLQIVDHNYGSLFYGCVKILALKYLDNQRLRGFFMEPHGAINDFIHTHIGEIPTELRKLDYNQYLRSETVRLYWSPTNMPDAILDASRAKLDCIEMVHGDAGDLTKGLDVFYISNALTHSPVYKGNAERTALSLLVEGIESRVKFGGYVLSTSMEGCGIKKCFGLVHDAGMSGMWTSHALYVKRAAHAYDSATRRFRYMEQDKRSILISTPTEYTYLKPGSLRVNTRLTPEGYRRAAN